MRTDLVSGNNAAYTYPTSGGTSASTGAATNPTAASSNTAAAPAGSGASSSTGSTAVDSTSSTLATATEKAELKKTTDALNRYIQPQQGSLEFSVDESSGKTLLKVVDTETNQVLLQLPSKQALALSESVGKTPGMLLSDSA